MSVTPVLVEELVPAASRPRSPYVGLVPYGEGDAAFFFGRSTESAIVAANLRASRLTILYGPSGVGKTSLLLAGAVHHLREYAETAAADQSPIAICVFRSWRDDPRSGLTAAVREAMLSVPGADSLPPPAATLAETFSVWTNGGGTLLLVLDQFEEYFRYYPDEGNEERLTGFAAELAGIVNDPSLPVNVLLSIRDDAWAKLDRFEGHIPALFSNYLRVDHLDLEAAREAVEGPIAAWNESLPEGDQPYDIEPALVEAVLSATAGAKLTLTSGSETPVVEAPGDRIEAPFLQLVLERLWRETVAAGGHTLTLAQLEALGGAARIVENHLLDALGLLTPAEQDVAADCFRFLVSSDRTKIAHPVADLAEWTRRPEPEVAAVLDKLCTGRCGRILRPVAAPAEDEPESTSYELFHDILAEPILTWRHSHEQERARRAARRRQQRLLRVIAAGVVLLALMAGLTVFAFTQRSEAESQARKARSSELITMAATKLSVDPQESIELAAEAAKLDGSPEAEDILRRALLASRLRNVLSGGGSVSSAVYSPDGRRIVTASADGKARVFDKRGLLLRTLVNGSPVATAAFIGGRRVLTAGEDGLARLWNVAGGRVVRRFRQPSAIRGAWASPDGERILTVGGRQARLWRTDDGALVATVHSSRALTKGAFSLHRKLVAVAGNDPQATVLDASDGRLLHRFDQGDLITSVAFSPDGRQLVTTGVNKRARLWDAETGGLIRTFTGHTRAVTDAAFSPDGRLLVTVSADLTGRIYDVASGALQRQLVRHDGSIESVSFSSDGKSVVTASSDRTAAVWSAEAGDRHALLAGNADRVTSAEFNSDGTEVLTASKDAARIWDVQTRRPLRVLARENGLVTQVTPVGTDRLLVAGPGRRAELLQADGSLIPGFEMAQPVIAVGADVAGKQLAIATGTRVMLIPVDGGQARKLPPQPSAVTAVTFSRDGKQLATAGTDGIARLWSTGGSLLRNFGVHARSLTDVALSPDGSQLATSSKDEKARIWDAESGRLEQTLEGHKDKVTSVSFSPDGRLVLTSSRDHDGRVWNAHGGGPAVQVLSWHSGEVSDAAFSPDGRWIVTAGPTIAQLWRVGSDVHVLTFGIGGNTGRLTSVSFDPTSRKVLTTSEHGVVGEYRCELCGTLPELRAIAKARLAAIKS